MDKLAIRSLLVIVFGRTAALRETDFHVFAVGNGTYFLSKTITATLSVASGYCASISAELALFDTNMEYHAVIAEVDRLLSVTNSVSVTGIWINFTSTDNNSDGVLEFSWRNEPFSTGVWASTDPDGSCKFLTTPSTCCARVGVTSLLTNGFRDSSPGAVFSFLCKAINECLEGTARCNHACTDMTVGYVCSCRAGYALSNDNVTCLDVNECNRTTSPCQQTCNNTDGSYTCGCFRGYAMDARSSSCVDINECNTTRPCQQLCNNLNGSYYCSCNAGYFLANDSKTCLDINECNDVTTPPCHHTCHNNNGSFYCSCRSGFNLSTDFRTCLDIDECYVTPTVCGQTCNNTEGGYTCGCNRGYTLDNNNRSCSDVDECNNSPCHQSCNNTDGSFECSCDVGYTLNADQRFCDDVNECMASICQESCTNTRGSYFCSCPTGYTIHSDGTSCSDIDECATNSSICDGVCKNSLGGYTCECPKGYILNSSRCVDINECDEEMDNCSQIFNNTDGSYVCSCFDDYILKNDSVTCEKINTCKNGDFICQQNCTSPGTNMTCFCNPGFKLDIRDNSSCFDINECASNPCHQKCTNLQGSYSCSCHNGFTLDDDLVTCQRKQVYSSCPCSCLYSTRIPFLTPRLIQQEIAEMRKKLRMAKTSLLSYRLTKTSADDSRYTAQSVGYSGVALTCFFMATFIGPDVVTIARYFVGLLKR